MLIVLAINMQLLRS